MYPGSNYAPSVASKDPPPSYQDNNYTSLASTAGTSGTVRDILPHRCNIDQEGTALLPKRQAERPRALRLLCAILGSILLSILVAQNLSLIPCPLDNISAAAKRAIRREWKAQMKAHEALVNQWSSERAMHEQEKHQWEDERAQWQEERKKWEDDRKNEERHRKEVERKRQGVYWTDPVGETHCSAYGTRVYRATLKDIPIDLNWLEVCSDMPITIHGRSVDRPDDCQRNDHGEALASWSVNWDEPGCVPYWDKIHYKGCAEGKPGIAQFEARLWGINHGESWETLCATTPAQIDGRTFDHPTSCVNRGGFSGMVGIWEVPEKWC